MRTLRLAIGAAGVALLGYGLYGMLTDHYIDDPLGVLRWAIGGVLLHDGLWVPLVCLVGAVAVRTVPVRAALIVTAAVSAVALPVVLREGVNHGNPSVLPLPYLRNYLLTLAAIALLTAGWEAWRRRIPARAAATLRTAAQRKRSRRAERRERRRAAKRE